MSPSPGSTQRPSTAGPDINDALVTPSSRGCFRWWGGGLSGQLSVVSGQLDIRVWSPIEGSWQLHPEAISFARLVEET